MLIRAKTRRALGVPCEMLPSVAPRQQPLQHIDGIGKQMACFAF